MLLALVACMGCSHSGNSMGLQASAGLGSGSPSFHSPPALMQDDGEDAAGGDDESGDNGSDDEESGDDTEPSEEEPAEEEEEPAASPSMSDVLAQAAGQPEENTNLQNALDGVADYEVTYDTSLSHAENTPPELRALGEEFAGEESEVARRTQALWDFDLIDVLEDRYTRVEEEYAADPEEDFAPEDPENTFNYFQPRGDPFVITDLIPDELRPELSGTGLDGAVDPELLDRLRWAQYEANLRLIPIIVVGVIEAGPTRGCIYTISGWPSTRWIEEGRSHCLSWGAPFSITCSQVSEDRVVLTLRGHYDYRCNYAATNPVPRTFHVSH